MRKFTVKDFIAYNNPCFSCGNPINFRIGYTLIGSGEAGYLRPAIMPNHTEVDLIIKYSDMEALRLCIYHKTNKILTNSIQGLTNYLSSRKLYLTSTCDKCYTKIESQFLEFNLERRYINAVGLSSERLMVRDSENLYQITSSFIDETSLLVVDKIDKVKPLSPFQLKLPLLPKYRLKDKDNFIRKIKTYMTFS
jgi:hypothetical protein